MYCFRHWFLPLNLIHKFEVDTNTTIIMTMVDVAILRHTQWWRESCEEKWEMRKNQEKCKSWKELIVGVVDHNLWCHKATEKWQNWPTSYSKPYIGHNMNGMIHVLYSKYKIWNQINLFVSFTNHIISDFLNTLHGKQNYFRKSGPPCM